MYIMRILLCFALFLTSFMGAVLKKLPRDIAKATNDFGFELFYMLNQPGKNVVLSPFSINSSLYMSYVGAGRDTMTNMRKVLGITTSQATLSRTFGEYLTSLTSASHLTDGYNLYLNNGMWIQSGFTLLNNYKTTIQDSFGGYVDEVNFKKTSQVIYKINNEISKSTSGRITNFLTQNDIDSGMRILLTSVYLFKGEWKYPFSTANSRQALFHPYDKNKPVMTRTMFGEFMLPYYEDKFIQAIALPIKSRSTQPDMDLMVILPKKNTSTPPFNYLYNGKSLDQIALAMKSERVKVALPRFTFTIRIPLLGSLELLGMDKPFSPEADFSKITGKKNLFISEFLTEAFFSVNEAGVLAAAGSAAGFNIKSTYVHKKPKTFTADHPFLYLLRDSYSQVVHFVGEYDSPTPERFETPRVTLQPQAPREQQRQDAENPLEEGDVNDPSQVEGNPSEGT